VYTALTVLRELCRGADKSSAFPNCSTTNRIFLEWVKVRTTKSQVCGDQGGTCIANNFFFNHVACCFLDKAKDLSGPLIYRCVVWWKLRANHSNGKNNEVIRNKLAQAVILLTYILEVTSSNPCKCLQDKTFYTRTPVSPSPVPDTWTTSSRRRLRYSSITVTLTNEEGPCLIKS
jgi:hypothetical protein